jgi:hypothetical protein
VSPAAIVTTAAAAVVVAGSLAVVGLAWAEATAAREEATRG